MIAWLLGERRRREIEDSYSQLQDRPVVVPAHWAIEISNALRAYLRTGHLSLVDFQAVLETFDFMQIRIDQPIGVDEIGPIAQFALTHDLTAHDAAYVQLALRHRATLATLDNAMRRAAAALNIPLIPA